MAKLDDFTRAYIECALWSSVDDECEPLDANYDESDIAPETLAAMIADCERFQNDNADFIDDDSCLRSNEEWNASQLAGHDFWLTRNGHGTGFWDSGRWREPAASKLTKSADRFREVELYVGDDGLIYC